MPRSLRWRSLGGGIAAFAALILLVFAIVRYARVGSLGGDAVDLYIATSEVSGVIEGTEVWLAGQPVGAVKDIGFAPPDRPLASRVILRTTIRRRALALIRRDSRAELRNGGTIIGAPVLYVWPGTPASPAVREGDTLRAIPRLNAEQGIAAAETVLTTLPELVGDARVVARRAGETRAAMQRVVAGGGVSTMMGRVASLKRGFQSGDGSLGRLANARDSLLTGAQHMFATMDTVRTLVTGRAAALGRFRRDSTLAVALRDVAADLALLRDRANSPVGTVGRFRRDSAIYAALDSVHAELHALLADVKANPRRYIHVF